MQWSKYNLIYSSPEHGELLFNFLSGVFMELNDTPSKTLINELKNGNMEALATEDKSVKDFLLSSAIINTDGDETNLNLLKLQSQMNRFDKRYRSITILPTVNCNLKCGYCFVGENIANKSMTPEVVAKLKEFIQENYADAENVYLQWFGGEPLLEFGIMKDISQFMDAAGIKYDASIVTNGVLLNQEIVNAFEELHIKDIQITFDGIKETHDKKRIFKNGEGTFDIIFKNMGLIYEMYKDNIIVNVRINVDRQNMDEYHTLRSVVKKHYPSFFVYPGILMNYNSCNSAVNCFANNMEVAEFMIEQYEKYGIDDMRFYPALKGTTICTAEGLNNNIVGVEGEIYLCLKDVGDKNEIAGSIFNGKTNIKIVTDYYVKYFAYDDSSCKKCHILPLCGGGCTNLKYRNKKYNEAHDTCAQFKNINILKKYLDIHYKIRKKYANA